MAVILSRAGDHRESSCMFVMVALFVNAGEDRLRAVAC